METIDKASLNLDEVAIIIEDQLQMYDFNERQKESINELKQRCVGTQNRLKDNKKKINNEIRQVIEDMDNMKDIYQLKATSKDTK